MNARMTVAPAQKLLGVHRLTQVEVDRIINNNCTEDFCKLQGVPGYCLQKLSWEAACQLAREATFESLGTLGRHPSDIVVYRRFRGKVSGCKQPRLMYCTCSALLYHHTEGSSI